MFLRKCLIPLSLLLSRLASAEPHCCRVDQSLCSLVDVFADACVGYIACFSQASIPSLLQPSAASIPPATKARLWSCLYRIGARTAPFFAFVPTASFLYLAYHESSFSATRAQLYASAAGLTLAIVPYTLIGMRAVNDKLHAKADGKEKDDTRQPPQLEDANMRDLLTEWAWWNAGRSLLPLGGCVLGWYATLGEWSG